MASPRDFIPINLRHVDERQGRRRMRELIKSAKARGEDASGNKLGWVGFAAETALINAFERGPMKDRASLAESPTFETDLILKPPASNPTKIEVKTRVCRSGWTHPELFDYVGVPMHHGREPVKDAADLVWFCWWSADRPRLIWLLGQLRGADEFKAASTFYQPGELLPKGGYVREEDGGQYIIEIDRLRPIPAGLFRETL